MGRDEELRDGFGIVPKRSGSREELMMVLGDDGWRAIDVGKVDR